jgi:hypothetical protein
MLFTTALILFVGWVLGVLGVYQGGTLVHALLLVSMMLFLLAVLRARDARRTIPSGADK